MKKFLIILAVIVLGLMAFFYYGTYSEGVRAGTIIKVSKRGTIFKTYEGQLNVEAFGAVKGKSTMTEAFEFSIPRDSSLIAEIEDVTGKRVKLYYKEKYFLFPWLGETKYLATKVELNASEDEEVSSQKSYPRR